MSPRNPDFRPSVIQWQHRCNGDVIKEPRCDVIHRCTVHAMGTYRRPANPLDDGCVGLRCFEIVALVIAHKTEIKLFTCGTV